jgi:hypothetical protein
MCLICLMSPASSAIILLVALLIVSHSAVFVGGQQARPKPILTFFQLCIRPPPLD